MDALKNLTRTEISALISVAIFCFTILVSTVTPAEAQGLHPAEATNPSTVTAYLA
jgi:hypothetical protein